MDRDRVGERRAPLKEHHFNQLVRVPRDVDIQATWETGDVAERRFLIEEMIEADFAYPEHDEISVVHFPRLDAPFDEVGLKGSADAGVGGPTSTISDWRLAEWSIKSL